MVYTLCCCFRLFSSQFFLERVNIMNRQMLERLRTAAVIVIALIFMVSIFMRFKDRMNTQLAESTASYLSGNVDALATAIQTKLEDQMVMLESQSRYFSDVDLNDYNAMKKAIMSTRGMKSFTSIGVASKAGSTMNYEGKSSGNFLLRDYFQHAMTGQNAISGEPSIDEFGNEVLVLAVPIWQKEQVAGVIYGTFTRDALSDLLQNVRFGDESASVLVSKSGTILARTSDSDLIDKDSEKIQDVVPGLKLDSTADNDFISYKNGDQENILVLRPIGFHDWYFGMIVSRDIVSEQSDNISRYVVLVMFEMAFMVAGLLLYIYLVGKHNERVHSRLKERADTDTLTDILNKSAFQETVSGILKKMGDQESCALFIIDLDNFKLVNDNLGHAVGDQVLAEVADKLKRIFRDSDLVGRIGGDEFAAFLRCPANQGYDMEALVHNKAAAIVAVLNKVYEADGNQVEVSASVGMAIYPEHGRDYKTLYENADKALYSAKRGGKNRYETYG